MARPQEIADEFERLYVIQLNILLHNVNQPSAIDVADDVIVIVHETHGQGNLRATTAHCQNRLDAMMRDGRLPGRKPRP